MKKLISSLIVLLVVMLCFTGGALAAARLLPKGVVVSAKVNAKGTAQVSIVGVVPTDVEFYSYGRTKHLGSINKFKIDLNSGRRFNFKFKVNGSEYFALLTPEMVMLSPDFFGPGIGLDCSNVEGCVFLVTGN